jgi:uncharacterized membrane protein YgdD (TMEM256/DUF423 family)
LIQRTLAALGALYGLLAVMLAALGAHLLPVDAIEAQKLWGTALQIHMFHAAAMLAVAALGQLRRSHFVSWCGLLMALGVLLFSGSLYLRAAGFDLFPGPITPVGGGVIMLSWIMLILILIKKSEI